MKRRDFLKSSALAVGAAGAASLTSTLRSQAADTSAKAGREYYELRLYHLRRGPKQKLFDGYAKEALVPALTRLGLGPIGVFHVMAGPDSPTAYVLIPYRSLEDFALTGERLRADTHYLEAGAEFINCPAADAAYVRVESSLMAAFEGMPKLEAPQAKSRLFELRLYESHSQKAHLKKVEMFNVGEIAIFRRTGLQPVFFGQTLIGAKLPNLTYMLVFESMAKRDQNWGAFAGDEEWKKLSTTPGYTDPEIVSSISNLFLRPAACSQI